MTFGDRLRAVVAWRGWTLKQFAHEAGIPYSTFQGYLADKRAASADHLARLRRMGVDLNWLVCGELTVGYFITLNGEELGEAVALGAATEAIEKFAGDALTWAAANGRVRSSGEPPALEAQVKLALSFLRMQLRVARTELPSIPVSGSLAERRRALFQAVAIATTSELVKSGRFGDDAPADD